MNPNGKLLVCLYSDANFLAVGILENLLSGGCLVNVISDDIKNWQAATSKISAKNKFAFCKVNDANRDQVYDYVIFCGGFINKNSVATEYKKFCSLVNPNQQKTFVLLPFEIYNTTSGLVNVSDKSAAIYLGDLLGPRINLNSNLLLPASIAEIINERKFSVSVGELFYPVFVPEVVRLITKWMFAFGPYGKEILVLGPETSSSVFWKKNIKFVGEIKLQYTNNTQGRLLPKGVDIQRTVTDPDLCLKETYNWIAQNFTAKPTKIEKVKSKKIDNKNIRHFSKKTKTTISLILFVLVFPLIAMAASIGFTFLAFKEFTLGHDNLVNDSLQISRTFATVSAKESRAVGYIPIIGKFYKETAYVSDVSIDTTLIAEDLIPVAKSIAKLLDNVLGSTPYDSTSLLSDARVHLQNVYADIQSLQDVTRTYSQGGVLTAKFVLSKFDIEKYKKLILQGSILAGKIPELLGKGQSKTYLVLFENNMELRPTGGFIGSYGLITFDEGRLSDFVVSDVYSADGQLNGHVEPPAPIKNYLNEANWWLRDSNWDPDFPTSAKRAEWFLDKEINKQVDGVFSTDLSPVRDILKLTGPVFLSDYNLSITSDNLYEKTQAEATDNFFPGAHNKASFLTALSRNLIGEIGGLGFDKKYQLLLSFYKSLEERHIQIFLHDGTSQDSISSLGWDGSVSTPTCGDSCYADTLGIVEANVGDNKSNYFIKRNIDLGVGLSVNGIDRKMTMDISNSANMGLGVSGKYKSYIRFIVPENVTNFDVKSVSGQSVEDLPTDVVDAKGLKEIGFLVEVLPEQTSEIVFSWTTSLSISQISSYGLYIRKQAGVDDYPINVNLSFPEGLTGSDSRFALTKTGTYLYNTTLSKDLFAKFTF